MQPDPPPFATLARKSPAPQRKPAVLSVCAHALALLAIFGVLHRAPTLAVYKLPGTQQGVRLITYYAPGSATPAKNDLQVKTATLKSTPSTHTPAASVKPQLADASSPSADQGAASSAQSGLGDGNITIALGKFFPPPKPSLASLPRGTVGDVILRATIDEQGKIASLALVQGLGPEIDDQVIQTVNQWTYTPATRNGVPVASVQELHFHYERNS